MTKYTRSIEKLTASIKDIFNTPNLSLDTKAIVLVLAATMQSDKFIEFITPLGALAAIRTTLLEINNMRCKYGDLYRDYIILSALKQTQHDINSDELQRFISDVSGSAIKQSTDSLTPALSLTELEAQKNWQEHVDPRTFIDTQHKVASFLIENLANNSKDHTQTITDAYLHCRCQEKPLVAYYAVIYVMADILIAGGLDQKYALLYSYKLARKALDRFIQNPGKNSILHSFNSIA